MCKPSEKLKHKNTRNEAIEEKIKETKMPYFDDLVMNTIISYCGLKPQEDMFSVGVYVLIEKFNIPLHQHAPFIEKQVYRISRRTDNYVWISNKYLSNQWSKPTRMKIYYINGIETLEGGKYNGLPITSKCRLDSIFTKTLWNSLTIQEQYTRYLKMNVYGFRTNI